MSGRLHLALLRGAALLIRAAEREEWLAEWRAELWYAPPKTRTAFCLGAFQDAFWLRRNRSTPTVYLQSPWECLALLAALAALSIFLAFRLPTVRQIVRPPRHGPLVLINHVPIDDYRRLAQGSSDFAFYRFEQRADLTLVIASRNLFNLLKAPVPAGLRNATLILSDRAWHRQFHADPHAIGRRIAIAGQSVQIAAILPENGWRLPGLADGWLLTDDLGMAPGHVLARRNTQGGIGSFPSVPVPDQYPLVAFALVLLGACLVMPTVTDVSLGEYPAKAPLRRWIFLGAKTALVLPIVLLGTLDAFSLIAPSMLAHAMIVGAVAGFRWVLLDQRRRCPICLRTLAHPTSIGQVSHTFLEWYGTELVCGRGHGLLHVPEIRSSFSTARWQRLDSSWSSLFSA